MRQRRKKPVEYVTREMLADLRDEIEDVLENARKACSEATRARRYNYERGKNEAMKTLRADVDEMRLVLGLDKSKRVCDPAVLSEPISWSYFHAWIARINERIKHLEEK